MRYEIRPMSFGEILDVGFRLLRNHFVLLVGCALLVYVPLGYATQRLESNPADAGLGLLLLVLVIFSVSPLVTVALTIAVAECFLGRPPSAGDVLRRTFAVFMPIMGTFLLASLVIGVGLLLLILPGLYLAIALYLVTTVAALEKQYGLQAIRRSRELMHGNLWRAIGLIVLSWIVITAVGSGVGFALSQVPALLPLGSGIVNSIAVAYFTAVSVVLYFDIRCRKEAFDLEHLASLVSTAESELTAPATA
jgi:hypothetical protein